MKQLGRVQLGRVQLGRDQLSGVQLGKRGYSGYRGGYIEDVKIPSPTAQAALARWEMEARLAKRLEIRRIEAIKASEASKTVGGIGVLKRLFSTAASILMAKKSVTIKEALKKEALKKGSKKDVPKKVTKKVTKKDQNTQVEISSIERLSQELALIELEQKQISKLIGLPTSRKEEIMLEEFTMDEFAKVLESDEGTLKINMINMIDKIEKAMIEKAKIEKAKIEKAKSTVKAVSERVSEPVEKDESLLKEAKSKMDDMVILKRDGIGLFQLSEIDKWDITSLERLKEEIKIVRSILTSVNKKGYVNDTRLIDYPLYAELVMAFVELKDEDKINGSYQEILEKKESLLRTHEKINLSRWIHSLININMYYLTASIKAREEGIKTKLKLEESGQSGELTLDVKGNSERWDDLMVDIDTLSRSFYEGIDGTIREHMRQKGVTITRNIYTGFDGEWEKVDLMRNNLLSIQWAVSTKILLKIPMIKSYRLSGMNTDTGVKYPINRKWYLNSRLRYAILERLIADYAESIRGLKYSENDKSIVKITNGLIKEGIPYTEKSGSYVFSFERSPIETRVDTIKDTPDLKELTLGEFVAISNDMAKKELDEGAGMVVELMKELFAKEVPESKEPLTVYLNEDRNIKNLEDPKDMEYTRIDDESKLKISKKTKKSKKVVEKTRKVKKAAVVDVKATKVEDVKTTGVDEIKAMRRTTKTSFTNDRISLTTVTNNYLIGHATHADLSLFKDFDIWKEELDIVGKSFVTRGKPILINGCNVYVRDTMLLTSENQKSLGAISKMYGERLMKIKLPEGTYEDMNKFLEEDPEGFKAYGERDAVIPLIHAFNMENRNFILGNTTVPLTISSMSGNYIKDHWRKNEYGGYQISIDYLLGDASKTMTPRGMFAAGDIGIKLPLYISNYRGGRNESFMYGIDETSKWYDYDLKGAYSTAMSMMGNPDYANARLMSSEEIKNMTRDELINSYTIIKTEFEFPEKTKYPSIPCNADEITIVYPLRGRAVLTGLEYLVAVNQGCNIKIEEAFQIPFEKEYELDEFGQRTEVFKYINHPFKTCVKELQDERRRQPKRTFLNYFYKLLVNAIYGLIVQGINNKKKFDIKTGGTVRMEGSELSNPILASWITAFVRSLLGELLHETNKLGGRIISVTTDGFLTDIEDLESKLLKTVNYDKGLLKHYRSTRNYLTTVRKTPVDPENPEIIDESLLDPTALEIKTVTEGAMFSWTVRGQFSKDSIKAMTGYRARDISDEELEDILRETFKSEDKSLEWVKNTLRSASEIYKKGGQVTDKFSDQIYRLHYDNRRIVEGSFAVDEEEGKPIMKLLDSRPPKTVEDVLILRHMNSMSKTKIYQKRTSLRSGNAYKSYLEVAVRTFIKDLFNDNLNLKSKEFKNYNEIIDFINNFEKESGLKVKNRYTKAHISMLKSRGYANKVSGVVPLTKETRIFGDYIKKRFSDFDIKKFYK